MSRMLIRTGIVCFAVGLAWLLAGRRIILLFDGIITVRKRSLPITPLKYDGGGLRIGDVQLTFASIDNLRHDIDLTSDSSRRTYLCAGRDLFPLGLRTNAEDTRGRVDIDFVAEPGDEVRLTASQSLLSWPAFLKIRIMGPPTPRWKRYVYYRLKWNKAGGKRLDMFWRYEQQYHAASGWTRPAMMWNSQTGLLRASILP